MAGRILIILNALGCLLLTVLLVIQWNNERHLDAQLDQAREALVAADARLGEEMEKRQALEQDVEMLKESLKSAKQVIESQVEQLELREASILSLQKEVQMTAEQLAAWEDAIKQRDQQIEAMNAELLATRKRLDEAVEQLKSSN